MCIKKNLVIFVFIALSMLSACQPITNSENACPIGNATITGVKDRDKVERYDDGIDTIVNEYMRSRSKNSCGVVVVTQNQIRTINGYGDPFAPGVTAYDPDTPWVAQTRFYVGSISKTITALAMLRLAEEDNSINLSQGVGALFPPVMEVPEWSGISLRSYLAHSSGVPKDPDLSLVNDESIFDAQGGPHPGIHPRYAYEAYRNKTPRIEGFEGQFSARYSNIGYSLIGAAIDYQTAANPSDDSVGYEGYVFNNIARNGNLPGEPTMISMCLGTKWRAPFMQNLAQGWDASGTSMLPPPQYSGWEGPSGGWTMTVGDLGRLMIVINTNKRISQSLRDDEMLNPIAMGPKSSPLQWGLGVYSSSNGHGAFYGKGGDIDGFTADLFSYHEAGIGAAMVCNGSENDHSQMRQAIRDIIEPCFSAPGNQPSYCNPAVIQQQVN